MSDPENFLTRWSRRKRGATGADDAGPPPGERQREQVIPDAPAGGTADAAAAPARAADDGSTEPPFDLSRLPPIESITAESDIRAFLAPGVPAELRLAALRRAWVADPRVRDFVGLNDYDFDFHTPGVIPGFGSLEMTDELRREVLRIVSAGLPEADPTTVGAPPAVSSPAAEPAQPAAAIAEIDASQTSAAPAGDAAAAGPDHPSRAQDELISAQATTHRNKDSAAPQQEQSHSENLQTLARRGHGRALPQ